MSRCLALLSAPFLLLMTATSWSADDQDQAEPWHWLLGSHSNYQHTLRNPELAPTPILYKVQRLDAVDAEGIVLLSQQAYLFTPDEPVRRRVYQFIQRRQGWVQHIFEIAPSLTLDDISQAENWRPLHGCSMRWEHRGDHFLGNNSPQDCYFFVEESGERVAVASSVHLYPDYFVVRDRLAMSADSASQSEIENTHSEYQRTMFYDGSIAYSAHRNDQWQSADLTAQLHDQGARVGLVLQESGLELRYQIELQRTLSELTFKLYDISRGEVVHEETFAADTEVIEFNAEGLQIRLKPRP